MTAGFTKLQADVAELTTVVGSTLALLNGLLDKLKDVTTDEQLAQVITDLEANKQELADAVLANTPDVVPPAITR